MTKWIVAAALLAGASLSANAQQTHEQVAYFPPGATTLAPAAPAEWSYSPYTSGMSACPERSSTDVSCNERMPPSYGQQNFRAQ